MHVYFFLNLFFAAPFLPAFAFRFFELELEKVDPNAVTSSPMFPIVDICFDLCFIFLLIGRRVK